MLVPTTHHVTGDNSQRGLDLGSSVNWLRVPMYKAIYASLRLDVGEGLVKGKRAIEIGGSEGTIARMLTKLGADVEIAPGYPRVDAERLPYGEGTADIIVLDQILEHLRHPWVAVDQVRKVLRPNGFSVCTSVFLYPIHKGSAYGDYYRFSPEGFRALFDGFRIISADGWGNAKTIRMAYGRSDRGPEGPSPMSNKDIATSRVYDFSDSMNYLMTWCIAQKIVRSSSSQAGS